jgi:hypothetical protein
MKNTAATAAPLAIGSRIGQPETFSLTWTAWLATDLPNSHMF